MGLYDPLRWATDPQLRAFAAWQTERALRSSPDAEPLREFVRTTFGGAWTYAVLGI